MSILDSNIAPYLMIIAGTAFLIAFFKHWLVRILLIVAIELAFLVMYPQFLVKLANLVQLIRHSLS